MQIQTIVWNGRNVGSPTITSEKGSHILVGTWKVFLSNKTLPEIKSGRVYNARPVQTKTQQWILVNDLNAPELEKNHHLVIVRTDRAYSAGGNGSTAVAQGDPTKLATSTSTRFGLRGGGRPSRSETSLWVLKPGDLLEAVTEDGLKFWITVAVNVVTGESEVRRLTQQALDILRRSN